MTTIVTLKRTIKLHSGRILEGGRKVEAKVGKNLEGKIIWYAIGNDLFSVRDVE